MPALRKRGRTVTATEQPQAISGNDDEHKISEYELSREQRIRENRERMGKLGIFDLSLSLKLKPQPPPSRRSPSIPKSPLPLNPSDPPRRSSRLQNVTPVTYAEAPREKAERVGNRRIVIEEGSKPEVYTEEHEKLLGNTEKTWVLFVDGVGKDGKRIYDSVQGKTCHQCRQKTLGYRTRCCKCNMVQGQFCGDCLYMRYGEHVLEALENPDWMCPVCRGICNCSLCRQAKGWAPTGTLYKKISRLGYKSVAHYLIQTRGSVIDVKKNEDASNSDIDIEKNEGASNSDLYVEKNEGASVSNPVSVQRSLPFSEEDVGKSHEIKEEENKLGSLKPLAETESDGDKVAVQRSLFLSGEQKQLENGEDLNTREPLASSTKPSPGSIAGRLRSRVKKP